MSSRVVAPVVLLLSLACVVPNDEPPSGGGEGTEGSDDQRGNAEEVELRSFELVLEDADETPHDKLEDGEEPPADSGDDADKSYVIELVDGGNAPFVAGCVGFSWDPKCADIILTEGDVCVNDIVIDEFTHDDVCRERKSNWPDGFTVWQDCDELCRFAQGQPGRCTKVPQACADFAGHNPDSAQCECYETELRHSDNDGGNAPGIPGCHWDWNDDGCSDTKTFISGDLCDDYDHHILYEWKYDDCHPGGELPVAIDCEKWCEAQHAEDWHGGCVAVADVCEGGGSAYCHCHPEL